MLHTWALSRTDSPYFCQADFQNGEQVKKVKVNRPKALCFDYLQLKETFGLDLEMEVVAENQEEIQTESNAIDLQQFKQNELPFE